MERKTVEKFMAPQKKKAEEYEQIRRERLYYLQHLLPDLDKIWYNRYSYNAVQYL